MARQIGCAPSSLSDILKGTKGISQNKALSMALKLGLSSSEAEYFGVLVQYSRANTDETKDFCQQRMRMLNPKREVKDLSVDAFKVIADWYHLPILEMTGIKDFRLNATEISKKLAITSLEAQTALERLERLELLQKNGDGNWERPADRILVSATTPNDALRSYHKQMLEKAIVSLSAQTPDEKFVGSETLAFDTKALPQAKQLTEKYFDDLILLAAKSTQKDSVYHLGVQLFRLTALSPTKAQRSSS